MILTLQVLLKRWITFSISTLVRLRRRSPPALFWSALARRRPVCCVESQADGKSSMLRPGTPLSLRVRVEQQEYQVGGSRKSRDRMRCLIGCWCTYINVRVCERVCIAIKMQNLHGCSNLPVPLDRPAGLAWQQVQHLHRDATASLGYI